MAKVPELFLVNFRVSEGFDEGNPVLDGQVRELSHEIVEDELEALDDTLQAALIVVLEIAFEDVVGLSELAADLTNEEFTPLDLHVFANGVAVSGLLLLHLLELERQAELLAVGIHVALFHEFKRFLGENGGEFSDISITAPVSVINAVFELHIAILLASHDAKVRISVLVDANRHLHLKEFGEVGRVLHLLHDKAFLHLADVFLLDNAHQVRKRAVDSVLLEAVTLLDAFAHKALTALLGQGRNDVVLDLIDIFGE